MSYPTREQMIEMATRGSEYLLASNKSLEETGLPAGDGWNLAKQKDKYQLKIWSRYRKVDDLADAPDAEVPEVCATGVMPCTPSQLHDIITNDDEKKRLEWDTASQSYHVLETVIEPPNSLIVTKVKTASMLMGLISSREYVCTRAVRADLPDGVITIVGDSVTHADVPDAPGVIRGWARDSGYVIKPENEGKCVITYMATTSTRGSIPYPLLLRGILSSAESTYEKWAKVIEKNVH